MAEQTHRPDPYAVSPAPLPPPPADGRPPTTGTAWAVLAMPFCWALAIPAWLSSLRAAAADGRRDVAEVAYAGSQARAFGIAGVVVGAAGLALAGAGAALALTLVTARLDPADTPAVTVNPEAGPLLERESLMGDRSVWDVALGSCYLVGDLPAEVTTVPVVDCAQPHGGEVYAMKFVGVEIDDVYPGEDAMRANAVDFCGAELEAFVGLPQAESRFAYWFTMPDAYESYHGQSKIRCFLESAADDVVGSARGTGR
ncbi:septum formation family protein [Antribacter sp. KLBMP9083]|uniref:Septum formation family protein n=1 Tax=Antribacter soli TaxID=2910976 RepID=A0AA41QK38_9MICO|nr:septum formation family protein [Antribacter soli]MCF4123732.1 septum formation family protein [Antribacter soli]